MIGTCYWKIPKVKVKSPLTPFPFYAGDCSPRLHVTLGHSGEPGESNGCSEVPSAYYNTNFKHNCLCCCFWNGAIFLCWEAFPFNSHSTLTVIEIAFYLFCFVRTLVLKIIRMDVKSRIQKCNEFALCCKINAISQINKSALIAWSFRVISNSDEKPRSVHLPVLVLGRESKGHIPLLYNW